MNAFRWVNLALALALACLAVLPAAAHVLELPNKFTLDGALWLAVQQHLYRGWGPFYGAPVEIGALLTNAVLLMLHRHDRALRRPALIAAIAYAAMLAAFFIFNQPVNQALTHWTEAGPPPDWPRFRRQWETGHAVAAAFSLLGLVAAARGWLIEHERGVLASRNLDRP